MHNANSECCFIYSENLPLESISLTLDETLDRIKEPYGIIPPRRSISLDTVSNDSTAWQWTSSWESCQTISNKLRSHIIQIEVARSELQSNTKRCMATCNVFNYSTKLSCFQMNAFSKAANLGEKKITSQLNLFST